MFAVDPLQIRREFALAHGADAAFDPTAVDAALQIKLATGKAGVDVSMETSGDHRVRCMMRFVAFANVARWCMCRGGRTTNAHLHLDESSFTIAPPLWAVRRGRVGATRIAIIRCGRMSGRTDGAIQLFRDRKVTGEGLITPVFDFEDAAVELAAAFARPETTIKIGVRVS